MHIYIKYICIYIERDRYLHAFIHEQYKEEKYH